MLFLNLKLCQLSFTICATHFSTTPVFDGKKKQIYSDSWMGRTTFDVRPDAGPNRDFFEPANGIIGRWWALKLGRAVCFFLKGLMDVYTFKFRSKNGKCGRYAADSLTAMPQALQAAAKTKGNIHSFVRRSDEGSSLKTRTRVSASRVVSSRG